MGARVALEPELLVACNGHVPWFCLAVFFLVPACDFFLVVEAGEGPVDAVGAVCFGAYLSPCAVRAPVSTGLFRDIIKSRLEVVGARVALEPELLAVCNAHVPRVFVAIFFRVPALDFFLVFKVGERLTSFSFSSTIGGHG